tara:strand:- start:1594 stop:2658 length:1065 start_codon:yes stop_codon:yes gene_type:complete
MGLKKNTIYKIFIIFFNFSFLLGDLVWVKYGWELFDYITDARSASIGNSNSSLNIKSVHSTINNPSLVYPLKQNISFTHQTRFNGMINNELVGFQLKKKSTIININLIYQGISNIPDTRNMLLDWGLDGQFGTNDIGEGNGIIDDGERLDKDKLKFFNQHQFGIHSAFSKEIMGFPVGIAYKIITYSLNKNFALGVGLDFGINKIFEKVSLGFVMKNLPTSGLIWENGRIEGTLPSGSLGISYMIDYFKTYSININLMGKLEFLLNDSSLDSFLSYKSMSLEKAYGLEFIYKDKIVWRMGRNNVNNFTGGIGLIWDPIGIDYAFLKPINDISIGNHHIISISISSLWLKSKISN